MLFRFVFFIFMNVSNGNIIGRISLKYVVDYYLCIYIFLRLCMNVINMGLKWGRDGE